MVFGPEIWHPAAIQDQGRNLITVERLPTKSHHVLRDHHKSECPRIPVYAIRPAGATHHRRIPRQRHGAFTNRKEHLLRRMPAEGRVSYVLSRRIALVSDKSLTNRLPSGYLLILSHKALSFQLQLVLSNRLPPAYHLIRSYSV